MGTYFDGGSRSEAAKKAWATRRAQGGKYNGATYNPETGGYSRPPVTRMGKYDAIGSGAPRMSSNLSGLFTYSGKKK